MTDQCRTTAVIIWYISDEVNNTHDRWAEGSRAQRGRGLNMWWWEGFVVLPHPIILPSDLTQVYFRILRLLRTYLGLILTEHNTLLNTLRLNSICISICKRIVASFASFPCRNTVRDRSPVCGFASDHLYFSMWACTLLLQGKSRNSR